MRIPIVLAWAACGPSEDPAATGGVDCARVVPTLTIAEPSGTVSGPDVEVRLEVTGFDWVEGTTARRDGFAPLSWLIPVAYAHDPTACPSGHAVLSLDGVEVGTTADGTFTLVGVPPGDHAVTAELAYPDGDGFFPPVVDEVTFTVR
jgi:hypothetical protein